MVSHTLDRIIVRGFKSIREMDIPLSNLNVLIGANGAGKTNFIAVFELLNQIVEENLQVFVAQSGGADALLYFGRKTTENIFINLHFAPNEYEVDLVPAAPDTLVFRSETCKRHGPSYPDPYELSLGSGHKETLLHQESRQRDSASIADHIIGSLRGWKVYHFHDTSDSAKVKLTGDIQDNIMLRPDASNLAAFLYLLRERHYESYKLIVDVIRLAAPFFDDFVLGPLPLHPDSILLRWREKGSDAHFGAQALSDGTLRFMCLSTLLLQPELPSAVLIDEPELGLHPYAITLLADMLESAATKTQIIVSTQSVPLVNQFSPEDIIVVDREDGQSVFKHLASEEVAEWLDEYGIGDLWEKNIIGGRPQR